jgi:REP element-mobilizing transposase RayT
MASRFPTGTRRTRIGRRSIPNQVYHVVASTADRCPLFEDLYCARQVVLSLRWLQDEGHARTLAFVVMPDHLHWLMRLHASRTLSSVVRSMKSVSANRINAKRNVATAVWQAGFYDSAIRRDEDLQAVARYIVANPLRGKLVNTLRNYPHWDAIWLDVPG